MLAEHTSRNGQQFLPPSSLLNSSRQAADDGDTLAKRRSLHNPDSAAALGSTRPGDCTHAGIAACAQPVHTAHWESGEIGHDNGNAPCSGLPRSPSCTPLRVWCLE
ncbi:hypothetical protein DPEC_G00367780 [Dallia pectoralis]|nr:hypothetical protein DPEC_G00367780 [Dallia pectoralis]